MHVQNIGTINTPKMSIYDVFHVSKISLNLLSVSQLYEVGVNIHFLSHGCFGQDPQTCEIGTSHRVGRLFELKSLHIPFKTIVLAITSSIWHARLGHLSDSRLESLISNDCLGHVKTEHFYCVSWQLSKHHALPFSNNDFISSVPLDLIHFDIWGPAPHVTIGGSRYFVIFINNYSIFT